MLENIKN